MKQFEGAETPEIPVKKVHFIRHGKPVTSPEINPETYGTSEMPFADFLEAIDVPKSINLPLSENGKAEIRANTEQMSAEILSHVKILISSPYLRCRQTAEEVSKIIEEKTGNKLEVIESDYLKEVEFDTTLLDEETYKTMIANPKIGFAGILDFYVEKWYNGNSKTENVDDTYFRAKRFLTYLRRVRKWTKNDSVFISTHGWIGRIVKHVAEGGAKEDYHSTNMLKTGEVFSFSEDELLEIDF
ncbi:MAG: phosphoglycerate mutase family protein [Minisyncoccia bacterium]